MAKAQNELSSHSDTIDSQENKLNKLTQQNHQDKPIQLTQQSNRNNQNQPIGKVQPFLQWVGGKRRIAGQLIKYIPVNLNNYYEPFLGGGALFYNIKQRGMFRGYFLSDINLDLVNTYNAVKSDPDKVGSTLKEHETNHCREYYYRVKASNNSNDPYKISARLLYLNRYSFKGIYRVNKNGSLDSSFSTKEYKNNKIDQTLQSCSKLLNDNDSTSTNANTNTNTNTLIYACDYSFITPKAGDFVYLDPPYHQSGEKFYTRLPFDEGEQARLKRFAESLDSKGVKFMLSNSDTPFIRSLYRDFKISTVEVSYLIPNKREKKEELVIMNY